MEIRLLKSRIRNFVYYKKKSGILRRYKHKDKRILYFGIPMHTNLGDQAQKYCIRKWLNENYPEYEVIEIPTRVVVDTRFRFLEEMRKYVQTSDIFVFQSGYCTHDIEPSQEDLMHRIVIENFPSNMMLMFPQTVYFKNADRQALSSKVYSMAEKMLFLARDNTSYRTAEKMFPTLRVELFPDIVTSLIGTKHYDNERKGILVCARRDCEKFYSDDQLAEMIENLKKYAPVTISDTTIDNLDSYWLDNHFEEYFQDIIRQYSSYEVVITDRYHGTIFSLIAETPVIVLKTTDHKVSTGVDWFKGVYDIVEFAESLDEAIKKASLCLKNKKAACVHHEPYFADKYYSGLKAHFDEVGV